MTSDSAIPNLESNSALPNAASISNIPDVEVNHTLSNIEPNSTFFDEESNSIIPDAELNSVLLYLQSNFAEDNSDSLVPDIESNFAEDNSDSLVPDIESNFVEDNLDSLVPDIESNFAEDNLDSLVPDIESNFVEDNSDSLVPDIESNFAAENTELNSANLDSDLWDLNSLNSEILEQKGNNNFQVHFKSEGGRLLVILPTESQVPASELTWSDIWQQLKLRLKAGNRFWIANTAVHLIAQDRLLDGRQLQELAEAFNEIQLQLKSVASSRRQTAIAAVTSGYSVEQLQPETSLSTNFKANAIPQADTLYLETTVRSGAEIRHPGTVILLGDLNPGGIVVADGDILIWGRLRGIAHAGAGGNRECLIMALQMEPTQLRIADAVARAPEKSPAQFFPEVAHITPQGIRIARANDFSRNQLVRINQVP